MLISGGSPGTRVISWSLNWDCRPLFAMINLIVYVVPGKAMLVFNVIIFVSLKSVSWPGAYPKQLPLLKGFFVSVEDIFSGNLEPLKLQNQANSKLLPGSSGSTELEASICTITSLPTVLFEPPKILATRGVGVISIENFFSLLQNPSAQVMLIENRNSISLQILKCLAG